MSSSTTLSNTAMVFPGQGSQSVGMLGELAAAFPEVQETFSEASSVLGYDLWERVQSGPAELLNQTACTQPAMLCAGVATWRCWQSKSAEAPATMAGHSLGEYTALVCAGALQLRDAVALVAKRGEYMQGAVPEGAGAMAAVLGLEDDAVVALCERAAGGEVVSAVNFNAPGQIVIAGTSTAVERAMERAKKAGAKRVVRLPVSVPSHCSLMRPAADAFSADVAATPLRSPDITVVHNVDVGSHSDPAAIRELLVRQLYSPVRWVETIRALHARGITTVLEMGPGKVLAGLNKRIEKSMTALPVQRPEDLEQALAGSRPESAQ
ncbi:MAG: ACP S-malonyltransferase [Gammaproteobacteria bacterium]|jgi:[acyl-carrier-protein] S-malonyltransferase